MVAKCILIGESPYIPLELEIFKTVINQALEIIV